MKRLIVLVLALALALTILPQCLFTSRDPS